MRYGMAGLLVVSALLAASPALATSWNFSSTTGNLGTSESYTSDGLIITAYGYTMSNGATDLYGKNEGDIEAGMGIASDPYGDHEISSANYINLDVHALVEAGINSGWLRMSSVQDGEGYRICFGNALGALGTHCISRNLTRPIHLSWGDNTIIGITGTGRDVLLSRLIAGSDRQAPTPVPEPVSLVLLGSGLAGVALAGHKRRAANED